MRRSRVFHHRDSLTNGGGSHLLPSLYSVASTLQALAITTGYVDPNATPDQALLRVLPLLTTACVEVSIVEDFERFRQDVGGPEGAVAIIDSNGNCVWTSTEFLESRAQIADGSVDLQSLERSLTEILTSTNPNGDVDMGG